MSIHIKESEMIAEFAAKWKPDVMQDYFRANPPGDYQQVMEGLLKVLFPKKEYGEPDHTRVHTIDDGHYQGTLLFIIAESGYQPSTYWSAVVSYGSCSGCDTLCAIRDGSDDPETQSKDYATLALHLLQSMKQIT
jgi:hypothetical protein